MADKTKVALQWLTFQVWVAKGFVRPMCDPGLLEAVPILAPL